MPVIFAVGITRYCVSPSRSLRTTYPFASPSLISTTAQGDACPYSRSLGRHWVLMIFHSASESAAWTVSANAMNATSAVRARRIGMLFDHDARRGAAGAFARYFAPNLGGD